MYWHQKIERVLTKDEIEELLRAGHIFVQVKTDCEKQEILEVTSYGNDRKGESFFNSCALTREHLKQEVTIANVILQYEYELLSQNPRIIEVDLFPSDRFLNILPFSWATELLSEMNVDSLQPQGDGTCKEFFVLDNRIEFRYFGGELEAAFAMLLMQEKGFVRGVQQ